MAGFTTIALAVVGTAVTAYSAVKQASAAKKAAKAQQQSIALQKKAQQDQQKQQQVQQRASQVRATRITQIEAARARAGAAMFGGLESSGYRGGQAALGAGLGSGLGLSTELSGLSDRISMYNQKAMDFQADAAGFRADAAKYGAMSKFGQKILGMGMKGFGRSSPTPNTLSYGNTTGPFGYGLYT